MFLVDLAVVSGSVLVAAAVFSLAGIVAKVLGCGLPLLRVGVGMVPRGEVGLIVALVGLQRNTLSQPGYALVVFMTAATTLLAPPALKALFRTSKDAASRGAVGLGRAV